MVTAGVNPGVLDDLVRLCLELAGIVLAAAATALTSAGATQAAARTAPARAGPSRPTRARPRRASLRPCRPRLCRRPGTAAPATEAQLNSPYGVRVIPGGGFLVADTGHNVVRQVSREGVITRVAGTYGTVGHARDGGPATEAQLNSPRGLVVLPDGGFLVADLGNNVVRQVSRDGVITRVAGTYGPAGGHAGDGGPAAEAQLNSPGAMTALPGGGFLFSDTGNNVVRHVSPDGVITRVAGTYGPAGGHAGDGGPATDAQLNSPAGVAVLPGGGFLVSDQGNNVVRQVSRDGVITRVAGTYGPAGGHAGDGGPATEAQLDGPGV